MKKILAFVLVMMLAAMGLSACSTRTTTTTQATEAPIATEAPVAAATDAPTVAPADDAAGEIANDVPVEDTTTTTETQIG